MERGLLLTRQNEFGQGARPRRTGREDDKRSRREYDGNSHRDIVIDLSNQSVRTRMNTTRKEVQTFQDTPLSIKPPIRSGLIIAPTC